MTKLKTIDADDAFALIFELLKAHPWLNEPGVMHPEDAVAEQEAVAFLLAGDLSRQWDGCSPQARRVVNHLLLDFMGRLRTVMARRSWQVPKGSTKTAQALAVVAAEIARSHPHLQLRH